MSKVKVLTRSECVEDVKAHIHGMTFDDTLTFCISLLECFSDKFTEKELSDIHHEAFFMTSDIEDYKPIKVLKDTKATKILLTKR